MSQGVKVKRPQETETLERVPTSPDEVGRLQLVVSGAECLGTQSVADLKYEQRSFIERVRRLLSGPHHFEPFKFHALDGSFVLAQNPGLEGFCHTLWELEYFCGKALLQDQLPWFFPYTCALFREAGLSAEAEALEHIQWDPSLDSAQRYEAFKARIEAELHEGRRLLSEYDTAAWIREGRVYQVFLRAFNLVERRAILGQDPTEATGQIFADFSVDDLPGPVEAVRWTGVYPIGLFNAKGNGGGSPFSIKSLVDIDAMHGGPDACARKIDELHAQGVKSIFELLLNHTAVDCELVDEHPDIYIHVRQQPWDTRGYYDFTQPKTGERYWLRRGGYLFDGERYYWDDTLQLDISNPKTRAVLIASVKELVRRYRVDGFRVDMAYQLLHHELRKNWGAEMAFPLSDRMEDEFLVQLIREVKAEYPHVGFIAEGFWNWERLNAAGFDLMYGQNDIILSGSFRHIGWYEALKGRDSWTLTEAIKRAAFLHWQRGGQGMYCFIGHHDLPAPQGIFADWVYGATFLTLMLPLAHNWYAGTEVGFQEPCDENGKMISFNKRTLIRWRGLNFGYSRFVSDCLHQMRQIRDTFGALDMKALWPQDGSGWAGFMLRPALQTDGRKVLVLANPLDYPVHVCVNRPDLGIAHLELDLDRAGPHGQRIVWIDADGSTRMHTPGGV